MKAIKAILAEHDSWRLASSLSCHKCGNTWGQMAKLLWHETADGWCLKLAFNCLPCKASWEVLIAQEYRGHAWTLRQDSHEKGNTAYHEYIRSSEWRLKAEAAKERADQRCQVCNRHRSEVTLDAHHRTYERLGNELPEDITVLCRHCHELYEANKKTQSTGRQAHLRNQIPAEYRDLIKR